jgi:hypothetical protein
MLNNTQTGWRPVITKFAVIALVLYLVLKCLPVLAAAFQTNVPWTCSTSEEVMGALVSVGEELIITGEVDSLDLLMTVWASRSTGNWTIVASGMSTDDSKTSLSCVVLTGKNLRSFKAKTFI